MTDSTERVVLRGSPASIVTLSEWQARVDELTALLAEAGLSPAQIADDLRGTFGGITFRDSDGHSWRHDGATWWRWEEVRWEAGLPPPQLILDKVEFDVEPETVESDESNATDVFKGIPFSATHMVPATGMRAWVTPDPAGAAVSLDPWLGVEMLEQRADGWANIRCSNGFIAWVDGRLLEPQGTT